MSNLKPLNLKEDVKRFEAYQEQKEVEFQGCKHTDAKIQRGELRCPCGAAWSGPRINELYAALTQRS